MEQPIPINNPTDPAEVGKECLRRIATITDPAAAILTTHLFTEHWINQILIKFCPHFDLTDRSKIDFSYSQKLHIAYSIGKLPEKLFQNLKKLNKLRNDIAHQLDFDLTKMDLAYHSDEPEPGLAMTDFKPSYESTSGHNYVLNVTKWIFAATYMGLHSHCVKELGFTKDAVSTGR